MDKSRAVSDYNEFLIQKEKESKDRFKTMIETFFEEVYHINKDIEDLSVNEIDNGFIFKYSIVYGSNPSDKFFVLIKDGIDIFSRLIDNKDLYLTMRDHSVDYSIYFNIFFMSGVTDYRRSYNVVKEFVGPFINRLCKLHPNLEIILVEDRGSDKNGNPRPPYELPKHRYKEYFSSCFSSNTRVILKLNIQ